MLTAAVAAGKWTVQTAYEIGTISKYVKRNMNNAAYQAENMFLEIKNIRLDFVFSYYVSFCSKFHVVMSVTISE